MAQYLNPQAQPSLDLGLCYRSGRELIFNYALLAAILGLNPFANLLSLTILLAGILTLKMIWDLGAEWRFVKGQGLLAIIGSFFGALGACVMGFMSWLAVIIASIWLPVINPLAISAALWTWTWMIGRTVNEFYLSGYGSPRSNVRG
ncbi:MAG: hypothetical protein HC825_01475 [Oscillatoriales cyanobacterium RM1_1_9]|nr:hypothetical protein [Oscillatoriales cyanobacterium SM2_3_0]NJO44583.1 hypothetical protein [Oscillatoriales cyanobacterium RM2_1_1]NJO70732.1 hypothetical protein [Oscillatoriales cyanobacterium RM1_1_9]